MIYDRTISDVNSAVSLRKRGMPFTESEKRTLDRGMLTISTLNRIENKQKELRLLLNGIGYFETSIENREWTYSDIFYKTDLERICKNNVVLRDAFFVFKKTPRNADAKCHYVEINYLEKILSDLEKIVVEVTNGMLECDTFSCGDF